MARDRSRANGAMGVRPTRRRFLTTAGATAAGAMFLNVAEEKAEAGYMKKHADRPACVAKISSTDVISGGDGKYVRQWHIGADSTVTWTNDYKRAPGKKFKIAFVAFAPAPANKVLAATYDGTVEISDLNQFTTNATPFNGHESGSQVWVVAASQDGQSAVSATNSGEIMYWDIASQKVKGRLAACGDPVAGLAFLPHVAGHNDMFYAAHGEGDVVLYELVPILNPLPGQDTFTIVDKLNGHSHGNSHPVNSVAVLTASDGSIIGPVSGGFDMTVRIWGPTPTDPIRAHTDFVWRVAVAPGTAATGGTPGTPPKIASASEDNTVRLFGMDGVAFRDKLTGVDAVLKGDGGKMGVAFLDDTRVVYTVGDSGSHPQDVMVWDISGYSHT